MARARAMEMLAERIVTQRKISMTISMKISTWETKASRNLKRCSVMRFVGILIFSWTTDELLSVCDNSGCPRA